MSAILAITVAAIAALPLHTVGWPDPPLCLHVAINPKHDQLATSTTVSDDIILSTRARGICPRTISKGTMAG